MLMQTIDDSYLETLRHELVGASKGHRFQALDDLTAQLEDVSIESTVDKKQLVHIVKAVARIIVQYTASITTNIEGFVHFDDNVLPLLKFLLISVDVLSNATGGLTSDEVIPHWTPFILYTSAYFVSNELPESNAMQSYNVAVQLLEKCQKIHNVNTPQTLMAVSLCRLVSLSSQAASKEEWVASGSIHRRVLQWIVEQVSFPHFGGDTLGRLLALIFPLIDDLADPTQYVGARMLHHVVRNVTSTELRWYTDVLLEVLRRGVTTRQAATLDLLVASLVVCLDKLSPPNDFQFYDIFVPRLLNDCSLINDVALRLVYTRHLRTIITRVGAPHSIYIIRFLQPLIKVFVASLESVKCTLILETLEALRTTVLCAWPRIPAHVDRIMVGLVKAVSYCELFEVDLNEFSTKSESHTILALVEDILLLLYQLEQKAHGGNEEETRVEVLLTQVGNECKALMPFVSRMKLKLVGL